MIYDALPGGDQQWVVQMQLGFPVVCQCNVRSLKVLGLIDIVAHVTSMLLTLGHIGVADSDVSWVGNPISVDGSKVLHYLLAFNQK